MPITDLKPRPALHTDDKLDKAYQQFQILLNELRSKPLPEEVIQFINGEIEALNVLTDADKALKSQIKKKQSKVISRVEKTVKIVPKNHYRNLWMAMGMASFGIPMGVAFGVSLRNMAFIGIGIPIGLAIGVAIGTGMDKKALEEGRQLDIEIK